jgi:hypothetical protein
MAVELDGVHAVVVASYYMLIGYGLLRVISSKLLKTDPIASSSDSGAGPSGRLSLSREMAASAADTPLLINENSDRA